MKPFECRGLHPCTPSVAGRSARSHRRLALLACLRFACRRCKGVLILCNAGCSRRLSWVGTTARSR
jgi:hypothetical protein